MREGPAAIARQAEKQDARFKALGERLRHQDPHAMITVARGSSDHASAYLSYLTMLRLGRLSVSLPMSLVTMYDAPLDVAGTVAVAVSQSGRSPDVVEPIKRFRAGRAETVALVNDPASPLGEAAEWCLPLEAGPEYAVAATKSYIASLAAGARLVGHWANDSALLDGLQALPDALARAQDADWSRAVELLRDAERIMVVGRGLTLPVAMEAALKCKETAAIQAEAFSGAEIKHGPMALIDDGYPLLIFAPRGPSQAGQIKLAEEMRGRGASVLLAAPEDVASRDLLLPAAPVPELDAITAVAAFYPMVEALSRARGFDPDQPRHLNKVTLTR
ncbi:SIS domain-containing protein [Chitinimonas taiwanensis]|uniref:Glucosamine--fructose-6-phosphate aminotransferase (Isomerizing) n=1 Tax=Chitinimonas taiwanensis DSM 18899 TaxID=1121279 RepID=A0A1K2HHT5_9NEIS|nr:SIS domain-containing protein [Chitinimonas taiwanensis]SFZ75850.1 glucosamine--fructose-6-phosphate aminotransferase (isomerizing) [Chitinimonas taiwanensis DSM 18899]